MYVSGRKKGEKGKEKRREREKEIKRERERERANVGLFHSVVSINNL